MICGRRWPGVCAMSLALSLLGCASVLGDFSTGDGGTTEGGVAGEGGAQDSTAPGTDAGVDAPSDGSPTIGADGAGEGAADGNVSDADSSALCTTTTETDTDIADTLIAGGTCSSCNFGQLSTVKLGLGRALFKFAISSQAAGALTTGKVISLTMTVTRAATDAMCGGACPAAAGTFLAFPLTSRWVEGTGAMGSGASWLTRDGTTPWGAPGADQLGTDRGPQAASVTVDTVQPTADILLDVAQFTGSWVAPGSQSVLLVPVSATFYIASKENTNYARPTLKIVFCQ
jgi:hypothetical protein